MKRPEKTVAITDAMTWWLTKRRAFIVGNYEITLLAINHNQDCVKILIRNTETNEVHKSDVDSIDLNKDILA